eukprot:TRINITY_DN27106_c0_g2_i1.p1 TRINITY_DN27106_c0_g2~~TRINITY_DN27106_c0_g2_i1.p1  ORF type:complete len:185 (-),score=30.81 TRINITY_DN27106_c0_g2_i1:19-573(-)
MANPVAQNILREQAIALERHHATRMGWIDKPGTTFSVTGGKAVRIADLTRQADLNGFEGHVVSDAADEKGRIKVHLNGVNKRVWVHPAHLTHGMCKPAAIGQAVPRSASQAFLEAGISDVSTAAPSLLARSSATTASAPSLPALPALSSPMNSESLRSEVNKVSKAGRGFCRRADGGFFASTGI